jgi:hypothetical protein
MSFRSFGAALRAPHAGLSSARSWLAILFLCGGALLSGCVTDEDDGKVQAPAGLSYAMTSAIHVAGQPIVPNRPSVSGDPVTRYSVAPVLPAGLTIDAASGVIAGTPASVSAATVYVVTAENAGGSATARVQIEVRNTGAAPSGLTYWESAVIYTVGTAITANTATSTGGPISTFRIAPALPAGMAFNTQTGAITGTPTVVSAESSYTVTGNNGAGETTATLRIAVQAGVVAPASLAFSTPTARYVVAEAIVPNTPVVTGGAVIAYTVSPPLPVGLSMNTQTGVISGTPAVVQSQAVYTVTARNAGGSTQGQVQISIVARGS